MRRVVWLLIVEVAAIAATLTVAFDLREHGRVAPLGGVNEWGYRGPVAHQRQPREIRIAVVGGTRAFGWGVPASAIVAEIGHAVMRTTDRPGGGVQPVVVVNLGRMGALPDDYPEIIEHFAYLRPDYICVLDNLGVKGGSPLTGTDGTSGVYQLTGYAPTLPIVLREKGMMWRLGDVRRGYDAPAEPERDLGTSIVRRFIGTTFEATGQTLAAADRTLSSLVSRNHTSSQRSGGYAEAMMTAIESGRRHARGVVVVLSPAETPQQAANLRGLESLLDGRSEPTPWLRHVKLGDDPGLLGDAGLRLDGWNYSSAGVVRVAEKIVPALLSLIQP